MSIITDMTYLPYWWMNEEINIEKSRTSIAHINVVDTVESKCCILIAIYCKIKSVRVCFWTNQVPVLFVILIKFLPNISSWSTITGSFWLDIHDSVDKEVELLIGDPFSFVCSILVHKLWGSAISFVNKIRPLRKKVIYACF